MVFVEKMKSMKIYKQPCFLPTAEGNKKKDSAVILLTPSYESSKNLMNNSMFINKKRFESYFLDRDVSYYIGNKKLEEVDESFLYLEETKRSELKDSDFGIPEDRKFPLDTEEHVRSAIKLFGHAEESKKKSLAKRISRKASKYGIKIPDTTQCYKYLHEAIVEAFQPAEEDDNLDFKFSVPDTDIIDIKFEMDEKEKRWNSIVLVEGVAPKTLRGRSECLVIRDDMIYLDETESGICSKGGIAEIMYDVPGGGWDPNEPHDICAIRETNEEAKIDVKDVQYIDNYLTIDKVRPEGCYCDGLFSKVYIGKYAGKYTGPVADVDRADIAVSGSWYPIDEVYDKLNPIHKKAIDIYFGREPQLVEFEHPLDESKDASDIEDDFQKKTGYNFDLISVKDAVDKGYIESDWNTENKQGVVAICKETDKPAGFIYVNKSGNIGPLRIYDNYKGYGLSNDLMKYAIDKLGGKTLGVFKDNQVAMNLYKKFGFKETGESKKYKDGDEAVFMKLDEAVNSITMEDIEAFNKELNSWDYGVLVNGKVYTDADEIDWSKYKTIPINDIEKHHVGVCWDLVNYEYDWFTKNGIKPDAYMFVMQKSDNPDDIVTHTFIIFKMNGKQYWFESSWFGHQGVKEVKSYTDVVDELVEKYGDHDYSVFKYNPSGLDKNISNGDFFKKTTKNLVKNYEAVKEGTEFVLET